MTGMLYMRGDGNNKGRATTLQKNDCVFSDDSAAASRQWDGVVARARPGKTGRRSAAEIDKLWGLSPRQTMARKLLAIRR